MESPTLVGRHVRLEPLDHRHADELAAASAADPTLYSWSPVPQGGAETGRYITTALQGRDAGTVLPFAMVLLSNGTVIGSTRFFDIERWPWPAGHPCHGRSTPDVCEIGYTWLARSAIRTPANTDAKLLMLSYAFETWRVHRVCLHTDVRNARSRAAIERIGGKFEGVLRAHRMAADFVPRDSARYSIIATEWPAAKERLTRMMDSR